MSALTIKNLEKCFSTAIANNWHVGIAVTIPGKPGLTEVIINRPAALQDKWDYYKGAYTEDLKKEAFPEIQIKGFSCAPTAVGVAEDLLGV